ncbi:MAG: GNAT family N-acetyltransferase [Pseudomonadota bacterium]
MNDRWNYRCMTIDDYEQSVALWQAADGVSLRSADSRAGIEKYLLRNPGLSFVAEQQGHIIGTIMAGHDGKRGYVQHLTVATSHRRQGIATALVQQCLAALTQQGITKSHLNILADNEDARAFWTALGWYQRTDIHMYSFINGVDPNA